MLQPKPRLHAPPQLGVLYPRQAQALGAEAVLRALLPGAPKLQPQLEEALPQLGAQREAGAPLPAALPLH